MKKLVCTVLITLIFSCLAISLGAYTFYQSCYLDWTCIGTNTPQYEFLAGYGLDDDPSDGNFADFEDFRFLRNIDSQSSIPKRS